MTNQTPTPTPTDDHIAAAILAQLTEQRLQRWAAVRQRVPGSEARKDRVLTDLFERYRVNVVTVRGATYLRLTDDYTRVAAAAERDRAAQLGRPRSRCRDYVVV